MNAQTLDWNDIRFVLAVCHEGSLSGAARQLGVNHSTVFRRINTIENKLSVRLFERLSSGYVMTEAGEAVLDAGARMENEIIGLSHKLIGSDLRLSGVLRITAPDALAIKILMPHLSTFTNKYPDIQVELSIASQFLNLSQREADIAIRATSSPPDTLIGKRICNLGTTVYGNKSYLKSQKTDEFSWIMPDDELTNLPASRWLKKHYKTARVSFRSNSFLALLEATKNAQGVAPLPCFLADPENDLQRVIDPPEALKTELWLLTHPELRQTARVRAFTEFLKITLAKEKDLIEG